MSEPSPGMVVYRASRLEALLQPLQVLLAATPPPAVLAPQTVVAAHPGMRHWLHRELALRGGPRGIVANLDVVLPSHCLDLLAQAVLGREAVAVKPYRRASLRWRIHALLDQVDNGRLARYLQGGDAARRRFQLADRLARIYSQYLVYRADWLEAWARSPEAAPRDALLGPLWHRLRADIGQPHRGERMRALLHALKAGKGGIAGTGITEPLHLFGISHLAPDELAVFRAAAAHRLVVFYLPDPCREYWGGLADPRRALLEQSMLEPFGREAESWFFEQDRQHPLLARWGRLAQHFIMRLQGEEHGVQVDERHWQDQPEADEAPTDRLQRVQESIRRLQPGLMDVPLLVPSPTPANGHPPVPGTGTPDPDILAREMADPSLRVHACHTRLRELEVLRDQLLDAVERLPGLKASDIVVMAPDIRAYIPLFPAVFGAPGDPGAALPYHLADVPMASGHPVLGAFQRMLALPSSRLGAPELLDLLSEPAVALRHRLEDEDLPVISRWFADARVAWGLDAAHRKRLGVPAIREHTFEWGLDRLLAGVLLGELGDTEAQAVELPGGESLAPVGAISGPQMELLGRLERVLREVASLLDTCSRVQPASAWAAALGAHVDALFEVDRTDAGAIDALVQLKRIVAELGGEPAEAGLDPPLDFSVVREVLDAKMSAVPEHQRLLVGGITVCGMVPQRAIPFRVVAVLGLNDGEFPRAVADPGLDPMHRIRRIGDRDVRSDDRYLFLETLMSARDRLHLSYIGEGVRDGKPKNPAPPLAELMAALDDAGGLGPDHDIERPWRVRHPLQAFDQRYFLACPGDGYDGRLFSYSSDHLHMARRDGRAPSPFYRGPVDGPGAEAGDVSQGLAPDRGTTIALREVLGYYRDPARQVLSQRLRVRLEALEDERLSDTEPLDERFQPIDRVGRRLFFAAATDGSMSLPTDPPAWLRLTGVLPPGLPGQRAWAAERAKVEKLLEAARGHPLFIAGALPPRAATKLVCRVGDWRVGGELARVHAADAAHWIVDVFVRKKNGERRTEGALSFKERIPAFIEWGLLRLVQPASRAVRLCLLTEDADGPWQRAINDWDTRYVSAGVDAASMRDVLERKLAELLEFWARSQVRPAWYFPRTSWEVLATVAARRQAEDAIDPASAKWPDELKPARAFTGSGGDFGGGGERDHAPGYARLLAGDTSFEPGTPARIALEAAATHLHALIQLDAGTEATA